MKFPFMFSIGPFSIHPHLLMESLAYFIGFRIYLYTRSKERLTTMQAMWVVVGAAIGAMIGSKVLCLLEDPAKTMHFWDNFQYLMEGKTIVGGLLGGLIGVEWTKKKIGITKSTGDDMVFPLLMGMSIGRIGCFLTGLSDHTYGTPTTWWTGVDFGDGILRHPTQLYEIAFLMITALCFFLLKKQFAFPDGLLFQLFMTSYLLWRLVVDFIKPTPHPYLGLNNIQLACIIGLIYYCYKLWQWGKWKIEKEHNDAKKPSISVLRTNQ
ncbi:prolipoprotein diacylglyceryl transferase [Shimazuella sp. AN120528]|uniref:prolipoprotein diacylglyceryl transferase n=1 Tax=Shimazuella soli TaxID=1892854 RepID=UPI001F111B69|nr:prolipoprotein diacylglyceryl transferase family protein [Shimazuella soli]MCH5584102.1 prolipoprotein diacylglyceryl transferase [Shimazuella soli]